MMLLAEGLIQVLILWDKCLLKTLPGALVRDRIPVILIQILNRTLLAQTAAGAWSQEGCLEITAYGILTLKVLHSFPWHPTLQDAAVSAIRSGQQFLDQFQAEWTKPAYTWVGKTTYGSARLSEGYCLAAMKGLGTSYAWSDGMKSLVDIPEDRLSKLLQLFSTLQDFRSEPRWKMVASVQEAYTFLSQLKSAGSNFMPEQRGAKNEYVAFIPLTFILVNNHHRLFLSTNLLWDMMVHSLNNYHVDEYMESVVAKLSDANLEPVKAMIRHLCNAQESENLQAHAKPVGSSEKVTFRAENPRGQHEAAAIGQRMNGNDSQSNAIDYSTAGAHERYSVSTLTSVRAVLSHYIRATLNYPAILGASTNDRSNFLSKIRYVI